MHPSDGAASSSTVLHQHQHRPHPRGSHRHNKVAPWARKSHQSKKPGQQQKRTRRGGRGRSRRRYLELPEDHRLPWWYARMAASGLTPSGVEPSEEDGFPVVLPSGQAVYILPTAVNPHHAKTYMPCVTDDEPESDSDDSSSGWKHAFDESYDLNLSLEAPDCTPPDILALARARSVTFDDKPEGDDVVLERPPLHVSFSFLDVKDDDASSDSSVVSSSLSDDDESSS